MNRRGFLAALTGAVIDPERALWIPGKKLISIPKLGYDACRESIYRAIGFDPGMPGSEISGIAIMRRMASDQSFEEWHLAWERWDANRRRQYELLGQHLVEHLNLHNAEASSAQRSGRAYQRHLQK